MGTRETWRVDLRTTEAFGVPLLQVREDAPSSFAGRGLPKRKEQLVLRAAEAAEDHAQRVVEGCNGPERRVCATWGGRPWSSSDLKRLMAGVCLFRTPRCSTLEEDARAHEALHVFSGGGEEHVAVPVSYTHLTLPTICSV